MIQPVSTTGDPSMVAKVNLPLPRPRVRLVLLTAATTTAATLAIGWALMQVPAIKQRVSALLQPTPTVESIDSLGLRQAVIESRDTSLATGDLPEAAEMNGLLAREALKRAHGVHMAWLQRSNAVTNLYSQRDEKPQWNYRNTAADFFSFHLLAGLRLRPESMESLLKTWNAEAALRTKSGLCRPVMTADASEVSADHDELIFGSSEYVKDGLMSILEWHGPDFVRERMMSITDAIMAESRHASKFGPIPGQGAEVNGNMISVCTRLAMATGRSDYAEFAARIADAATQQALPGGGGLPVRFFDYQANRVADEEVHLSDHGNELMFGLSEAFAMAVAKSSDPASGAVWRERAARWAEPIARMYELTLAHGVGPDGLLATKMHARPPTIFSFKLNDNWGYVLNGTTLFVQAARRANLVDANRLSRLDSRVDEIAIATFAKLPLRPYSESSDADCDAIESAIYIAAYRPHLRKQAMDWADAQMQFLLDRQQPSGMIEGLYLDGNFIRTMLLYADSRTAGFRIEPWSGDVTIGYAEDDTGRASLVVRAEKPYTGRLVADRPRHRLYIGLPWNWPRLNSWPEWLTIDEKPTVEQVTGLDAQLNFDALTRGVDVNLDRGETITIRLKTKPTARDAIDSATANTGD